VYHRTTQVSRALQIYLQNRWESTRKWDGSHGLFEANTNDYSAGVTSLNPIPGPALLQPDYHIPLGSSAINRVPPLAWVTVDIDGDPRPTSVWSDAGADERDDVPLLTCYLPLVLR